MESSLKEGVTLYGALRVTGAIEFEIEELSQTRLMPLERSAVKHQMDEYRLYEYALLGTSFLSCQLDYTIMRSQLIWVYRTLSRPEHLSPEFRDILWPLV